ncbi:hypothetical protein GSI_06788 [Ganoderma sinense ZZ0214-1]|uniref:Lactam utilization protein lamB n=1 Tax=Ganoderma sinense ZZ0214-1 TaxID=1077348 RepID=A0A2G8SEA0_9APHY|nr:hypothetical protein GSI_06788 [Ganoderma sinense ZZ0214-1]
MTVLARRRFKGASDSFPYFDIGFALSKIGDDEGLIKTIHLANVACGFHASDFSIMNETVQLAKANNVLVGAHPSLPDKQGWGRGRTGFVLTSIRSARSPGFLRLHGVQLNHPHGAVYGMTARDIALGRAVVGVSKLYSVPFMGLAGTCHQAAAQELGVPFIAEWFADLDYSADGKLLITKKHDPVPLDVVTDRVNDLLEERKITTVGGFVPLLEYVTEVSICCHSDTPGAVEIAQGVKALVDQHNAR